MESEAHLIKRSELAKYDALADSLLKSVAWHSPLSHGETTSPRAAELKDIQNLLTPNKPSSLSLVKFGLSLNSAQFLMPESVNKTLLIVADGIRIGKYLQDHFSKAANIEILNRKTHRSVAEESELSKKSNTAAVVFAFCSAYYILFELSKHRSEEAAGVKLELAALPALDMSAPGRIRSAMLYYYAAYLETTGMVRTELEFVKMTLLYFERVLEEIQIKLDALEYKALFTRQAFKLEDSSFNIHGFEVNMPGQIKAVAFNKVFWNQIVGNTVSKHFARRNILSLMCYDPESRRNPMFDLGALPVRTMTHGIPGTGKSMEIAAMATELDERCQDLGIPFIFTPFPDNVISAYQGESAERMIAWMKPLQDPSKIIYAPIDDAENNLEERSNEGVSAGVKSVVGIFLRMTEGAYAVNHGNCLISLYTNLPEKIDRAVLSRIQARTVMEGAVTAHDFLDQDHIGLIAELQQMVPGFSDLKPASNYVYLSDQDIKTHIKHAFTARSQARVSRVADIITAVKKQHPGNTHDFFAQLDITIKKAFPYYSSRDKRNIHTAVKRRLFDFDFPEDWLSDPAVFFTRDYQHKRAMIIEVMKGSLQGKSFSDILLEESIAYFDNLAEIADKDFERQVERSLHAARVQREAALRFS